VVFKVDVKGNETILHSFSGSDGAFPTGPLLRDASGNLYGTAFLGGSSGCGGSGCGDVFKIDASGTFTVLYAFTGTNGDGEGAGPGIFRDSAGNLYGTTQDGGDYSGVCATYSGCGTVFKIDPTGHETVLYRFTGTNGDGALPFTTLAVDSAGDLYGTTAGGGDYSGVCAPSTPSGCGTVWKLNPTTRKETVLHVFNANQGDGATPNVGGYIDAHGNFYGTTVRGGNPKPCPASILPGCGIVFRIDTNGKYTVLHKFKGSDGQYPVGPFIQDKKGNFYNFTNGGGVYGGGTVLKMSTSDNSHFQVTTLFNFTSDQSEPQFPTGTVVRDAEGNLYGLTGGGGGWNKGTVFKLTPK
jgi:uncharacterized repeat protein (TIGR03803 family)